MKTAIVYYSMHGNVRYVAEKVAKELGADLIELKPVKAYPDKGAMQFIWGGSAVTFKKKPDLEPYSFNASDYDLVIIGTPVWAGKPCTAINQYLSDLKTPEKIIGAFAFAGGSADKCLSILREKLPSIRHTVSLADRNSKKLAPENESKLSAFIEELKS